MRDLLHEVLSLSGTDSASTDSPEGALPADDPRLAGADLYLCQECADANRNPVVILDRYLRCDVCGSDAVTSLARMEEARRRRQVNAAFCQAALRDMTSREEIQ